MQDRWARGPCIPPSKRGGALKGSAGDLHIVDVAVGKVRVVAAPCDARWARTLGTHGLLRLWSQDKGGGPPAVGSGMGAVRTQARTEPACTPVTLLLPVHVTTPMTGGAQSGRRGCDDTRCLPGMRSQCPPLGPLEVLARHCPPQLDAVCCTQGNGLGGPGGAGACTAIHQLRRTAKWGTGEANQSGHA